MGKGEARLSSDLCNKASTTGKERGKMSRVIVYFVHLGQRHSRANTAMTKAAREIEGMARTRSSTWFRLWPRWRKTGLALDLSRFSAAPSARLSHLAFESDGAFPTQC